MKTQALTRMPPILRFRRLLRPCGSAAGRSPTRQELSSPLTHVLLVVGVRGPFQPHRTLTEHWGLESCPLSFDCHNIALGHGPMIDPVCGMEVTPDDAAGSCEYQGQQYYFCAESCLEQFQANPQQFLAPPSAPVTKPAQDPGAIYTCPMDPEVRQRGPGACPKCGMALEPLTVSREEEANPELLLMTRRFWISLALTAPLVVMAMSAMVGGHSLGHALSPRLHAWIELVLATPVVLWGGWPFFQRGWASIVNRSLNMFTLIAMGTGTAYLYSLLATILPQIFPPSFRLSSGEVPAYFESAATITTLVLLGQVLELRARSRTSSALKALLGLAPKTARRLRARGRRGRCSSGSSRARRPPARAPRREDSCGWERDRRHEFCG